MDLSPAQPNTPCSFRGKHDCLDGIPAHEQPKPTDITGVPVKLTAVDSTGNTIDIGTTTSDALGNYAISWTLPSTGLYTIRAEF